MPIQVERATRAIRHELGHSLSTGMTALEVVELAYSAIFAAKQGWFWALRTIHLDTVANSKIIRLPADFSNMYRPSRGDHRLRVLTDPEFFTLRDAGVVASRNTFVCRQAEDDDGWYLEFVEEFEAVEEDKFYISYEAGPVSITDDHQTLPLPQHMHALLLSLSRAIAKGYEESDETSVELQVAHVMSGPTYDHAVRADMRKRPKGVDFGASRIRAIGRWNFENGVLSVISPGGTEIWPS